MLKNTLTVFPSTASTVLISLLLCSGGKSIYGLPRSDDGYCYPGQSCWPSWHEELVFANSLDGDSLLPTSEAYANYTIMINTRVTKYPYVIVLAQSLSDVIKCVKFANRFNIRLTIRSSGHDYIGRSTGDGTLQINLSKMQGLVFDLTSSRHADGELTAQSGNTWIRIYEEASKHGRTIVGGSAHTVSMGGYTLGGGHSPIGRKFGLAVDNLLEVEMVTANGTLVYANAQSTVFVDLETGTNTTTGNTDIFWAVRGGGGSTFGIVTAFTYKLHMDSKMARLTCYYALKDPYGNDIGRPFLKAFNDLLSTTLAPEWGGYEILTATTDKNYRGIIVLVLNHFGEWGSPSFNTIWPFWSKFLDNCQAANVTNFLDYEKTVHDDLYYHTYTFNTLMQPHGFNDDWYNFISTLLLSNFSMPIGAGCTGVLIGGAIGKTSSDATAIHPSFRTGVMSLTCGISWDGRLEVQPEETFAAYTADKLLTFGQGTYFNEPSEHLPNWKTDYWGGHYDRLLAIKRKWDPTNVFTCLHCVGSDLGRDLHGQGNVMPVGPIIG
ncbi:uncharacterized protein LOC127869190 [Dreissena polymorpha]|uniref:FAD-binding PCMH-type domain-containing protein n=1 Tax=Dreissena polymorpha TaxID=45954 RepID=A0A9D4MCR6_DREPO|nr:uncharacterized protein LOC127869190 [Dreissena polymorpha]KAH3874248.1 hypothetical protein DPMN_037490 [Dreissena polymorpha]